MLTALMEYPQIDPVALQLGPVAIRWYSLAYLVGLLGGAFIMAKRSEQPQVPFTRDDVWDFLTWAVIGVLLGARLGLVLFYYPSMIWEEPHMILAMWTGGMSFHGGVLGLVVAGWIFTTRRGIPKLAFGDELVCVAPIGLFFGRLANFINGELWGRPTDVSWAMVFPDDDLGLARHPSQLYEAFTEGLLLFLVLWALRRTVQQRYGTGLLLGVFLAGYGISRFTMEFFREPDAHLGLLVFNASMGQLLTVPMLLLGVYFIVRAMKTPPDVGRTKRVVGKEPAGSGEAG